MSPNGEAFDPSLIIFAALAVFVLWKLRSVLGVRVDRDEAPPAQQFQPRGTAPSSAAFVATNAPPQEREDRWRGVVEPNSGAEAGLEAILRVDPRFDAVGFLGGARRAYEMIVAAFAKGDRETLQPLLSKEVFDGFNAEIARREEKGETLETAVVAIDSATIDSARTLPKRNEIAVRFATRLMQVRRDRNGEMLEDGRTTPVVESWTFARDPGASDPNWKLVATRAVE